MASSDWNRYLDALLSQKLTAVEYRLALAVARLLCGWNRRSAHFGERLLRSTADLDGRSFARARDGLVAKGLLHYQPGAPGRGNRGLYTLPGDTEKPAAERAFREAEKPALERAKAASRKSPLSDTKKPALERARRGTSKERTSDASNELRRRAFDVYQGAGGNLQLERERGALARSVTSLAKDDVPDAQILAAVRDLGRKQEFPGLLKQRVTELAQQGGACEWEGLDRSRLTPSQLSGCDCARCEEWLVFTTTGKTSKSHGGS
jgi:hypothetical protein